MQFEERDLLQRPAWSFGGISHAHVLRMSHEPPPGVPVHAFVWLRSDEQATQFKLPGPQGLHLHRICRRITKDFHGQVIDDVVVNKEAQLEARPSPRSSCICQIAQVRSILFTPMNSQKGSPWLSHSRQRLPQCSWRGVVACRLPASPDQVANPF